VEVVKEKIPIKMKVDKITPNGKVGVNFNQPVIIPFDFVNNQDKTTRRLDGDTISLDQINPLDIFSIFFLLKSSDDSSSIAYSITFKEWTEDKIAVKLDFKSPLAIS
jgi:hypothetical protein